jgi:hypothetical protein
MGTGARLWEKFNIFALMFLFLVLIISHGIMLHWNRPPEMIRWVENFISMVMGALVQQLSGRKSEEKKDGATE